MSRKISVIAFCSRVFLGSINIVIIVNCTSSAQSDSRTILNERFISCYFSIASFLHYFMSAILVHWDVAVEGIEAFIFLDYFNSIMGTYTVLLEAVVVEHLLSALGLLGTHDCHRLI
eukprot:TRINITY_DN13853_c0_g2_i1.p1 TRINITY_DN13853_c0_g2~~TRINITY_DN13853_c0_g2_i1.p1  ORF type:complete len:117 (+),score=3.54 TRINITY_DN13853_c0_g2_i1:697-1047(+)